ncbi:MMPL family transporter [Paraneptunicella aestuarii]|uniref:efflux RND transporter permease subunit n=1 Tax=Paraneptunicella aestuarii TaxID=2831148 RepID=UPI001E6411F2|nr:MMPL family transporter [Paraneptunicella aestuarii]UAA37169.1 MMPL family transporter [Paraneptunicella aestuarii]
MQQFLASTSLFFEQVPDTVRRFKWLVWLGFFAISAIVFYGMPNVKVDMTMEAYFKKDDPAKLAFDKFRNDFGSDEVLFLTYKARDGDVFSDQSLKALHALQTRLNNYSLGQADTPEGLHHMTDVTSLINVSYMESQGGVLLSRPFIGDEFPENDEMREQLRQRALNHPDYTGVYFSKDSRIGAIVIKTDLSAQIEQTETDLASNQLDLEMADDKDLLVDMDATWSEGDVVEAGALPKYRQAEIVEYSLFMSAIEEVINNPEYTDYLEFHPTGLSATMAYLNDVILKQMGLVLFGSLLLILVVLWVLFHSSSAVIWSMLIVVMSFMLTLGLVGWSGAVMTIMINIIVFLIMTVGIANAIHILSGYLFFREKGEDHQQALRLVLKKSGLACFLTSLTTAIGLLSLTFTPIVPIQNFGIFAAVGVFLTFLMTVFMLPLMLDIWAPVSKKKQIQEFQRPHRLQRLLQDIEHLGYSYPKQIVAIFGVITVVLVMGIPKIKVDSNVVEILPHDSSVRKNVAIVDNNMAGSNVMDILFETGVSDAFKDPRLLNRMDELQQYIKATHGDMVGKTTSLVNVSKDAFKSLHDNDDNYYLIPQEQGVLAQTLFMFNNANAADRRQLVTDDYSTARMTITLKTAGSYVYVPMIEDINQHINTLFADVRQDYPDLQIQVTGGMSLMTRIVDYIAWSQIQSFALALVVISLLLLVVFGSKRVGLIAVIPNLMPILVAFGMMGYLNIPLDTDTLLIAPIIIGIAVDDTIHYLTHYRAGIMQTGNIRVAIHQAVREAGQAITFTSIVLALGFLIFVFSSQISLRNFGILSSLAIMMALVTDLLLLPALCVLFKAKFKGSPETSDPFNNSNQAISSL